MGYHRLFGRIILNANNVSIRQHGGVIWTSPRWAPAWQSRSGARISTMLSIHTTRAAGDAGSNGGDPSQLSLDTESEGIIQDIRRQLAEHDRDAHLEFINQIEEMWKKPPLASFNTASINGIKRLSLYLDDFVSNTGETDLAFQDMESDSMLPEIEFDENFDNTTARPMASDGTNAAELGADDKLADAFMEYFKLTKVEVTPELLEKRRKMREMYPDLFGDITDEELDY